MINGEYSRLDRVESILETITSKLDTVATNLEIITSKQAEHNARIDSNAKAIEALTQDVREDRRRANEQIARLYEQTVRVSAAQADFYEMQADFYRRIDAVEDRYAQMMEKITAVLERLENR